MGDCLSVYFGVSVFGGVVRYGGGTILQICNLAGTDAVRGLCSVT